MCGIGLARIVWSSYGSRAAACARRAKRRTTVHPKFYFFDAGVFRALRPRGPLDSDAEIDGPALETLVLAQIRAVNDAMHLGFAIHYWRTSAGAEVDFVLYGERGLYAVECKRSARACASEPSRTTRTVEATSAPNCSTEPSE